MHEWLWNVLRSLRSQRWHPWRIPSWWRPRWEPDKCLRVGSTTLSLGLGGYVTSAMSCVLTSYSTYINPNPLPLYSLRRCGATRASKGGDAIWASNVPAVPLLLRLNCRNDLCSEEKRVGCLARSLTAIVSLSDGFGPSPGTETQAKIV